MTAPVPHSTTYPMMAASKGSWVAEEAAALNARARVEFREVRDWSVAG